MRTSFAQTEIVYVPKKESRIKRALRAFVLSILVLAMLGLAAGYYISTLKLGSGISALTPCQPVSSKTATVVDDHQVSYQACR